MHSTDTELRQRLTVCSTNTPATGDGGTFVLNPDEEEQLEVKPGLISRSIFFSQGAYNICFIQMETRPTELPAIDMQLSGSYLKEKRACAGIYSYAHTWREH